MIALSQDNFIILVRRNAFLLKYNRPYNNGWTSSITYFILIISQIVFTHNDFKTTTIFLHTEETKILNRYTQSTIWIFICARVINSKKILPQIFPFYLFLFPFLLFSGTGKKKHNKTTWRKLTQKRRIWKSWNAVKRKNRNSHNYNKLLRFNYDFYKICLLKIIDLVELPSV